MINYNYYLICLITLIITLLVSFDYNKTMKDMVREWIGGGGADCS